MARRTARRGDIDLNLIPMLDAMVTIIAFLMYGMSFLAIVNIESILPVASPKINEKQIPERPLQLTLTLRDNELEIWSPFNRIQSVSVPNKSDGTIDFYQLHQNLVKVKERFPAEKKIVFVPAPSVSYDTLVAVMDSVRDLEAGDPPMYEDNQAITGLFPDIVFGNLLGE